jgi:hypothetical protein
LFLNDIFLTNSGLNLKHALQQWNQKFDSKLLKKLKLNSNGWKRFIYLA